MKECRCEPIYDGSAQGYLVESYRLAYDDKLYSPAIAFGELPDVSDILRNKGRLAGVICCKRPLGYTHAEVLLRELGIPLCFCGDLCFAGGEYVEISGGLIKEGGSRETKSAVRIPRERYATTADGERVELLCSAWDAESARAAAAARSNGIGLFRSEGAAAGGVTFAGQYALYVELQKITRGRELTVRTFDFSGDKACLSPRDAEAAKEIQLRALKAAAGPFMRVVLPEVESAQQVKAVRARMYGAAGLIEKFKLAAARPKIGAMIESEAGVKNAAEICAASDFVYIGLRSLRENYGGLSSGGLAAVASRIKDACALLGREITVCGADPAEHALLENLCAIGFKRMVFSAPELGRAIEGLSEAVFGLDIYKSVKSFTTIY